MGALQRSAWSVFVPLYLITIVAGRTINLNPELDEHWENFKSVYGKKHVGTEELKRRLAWERRVENIIHHNHRADMGLHSYKRGLNKYSDLSPEEVKQLGGLNRKKRSPIRLTTEFHYGDIGVPESVDWRQDGFVTPVKDQGTCGSCWAFAATGMMETQIRKETGKLVPLSEQNLVDCVPDDTPGCVDGLVEEALQYIQNFHAIATETSYPYFAKSGVCHSVDVRANLTVKAFKRIPSGDEEALKYAVALIGPLAVSIDTHHHSFLDYKTGIYDEPLCRNGRGSLNHSVLLVGYGTENGVDYWLVKNSWGTSFGVKGYIKMSRNKNNQCGIATEAIYPVM